MASRQIIERQGLYFMDHLTSKTALSNLNMILDSEKNDSESIFCQSQGEALYPDTISYDTFQKSTQFSERLFDGTIFQTSNTSYEGFLDKVQEKKLSDDKNLLIPKMDSQVIDSTEIFNSQIQQQEQDILREDELQKSSELIYGKQKIKERITTTKGEKKLVKKIDKEKNIFPNIAKRVAKMMFQDCKSLTQKYFKKRKILFSDFYKQYKNLMDSNCSGLALSDYFAVKQKKDEMSLCFIKLFQKYLRKRYMLLAMKRGKMEDLEKYISCKNRQLMYFSNYMKSPKLRD